MLAIKLQRVGKKGQPSYRLVVAPARSKMKAPPVEDLGAYNPFTKKAQFNGDRAKYWVSVGAQPTTTVHNLLVREKILTAPTRTIKMKAKAAEEKAAS
jgi:small subunit ribosomal protein S16